VQSIQLLIVTLPDRAGLAEDLASVVTGARDFEELLDLLRRWTGERRFQVGVQLLRRDTDGERAGAALADIAETALAVLLPAVTADFAPLKTVNMLSCCS